jgi:hypothetical protein
MFCDFNIIRACLPQVTEVTDSPQQQNSYDCGVYVCLCAQIFAAAPALLLLKKWEGGHTSNFDSSLSVMNEYVESIIASITSVVTPDRATEFRVECIERIEVLSNAYISGKQAVSI